MGFFNFGNNSKAEIQSCALKISTGLGQIEQEYASSNGQATPMVKGIASALQNEVRTLERLLKPNGRTDWNLYNSIAVKWYDGSEIPLQLFTARLNNEAKGMSIHGGQAPGAEDFSMVATSNWSVFFKFDQMTTTMGALIALKVWNEKVNIRYGMADDYKLLRIANAIIISNGNTL